MEAIRILEVYPESFRANIYTDDPFRMIGLIDVDIEYTYGIERVTLAFYRSSGTNSGKIQGLWYPIVGIKIKNGKFTEFSSDIINQSCLLNQHFTVILCIIVPRNLHMIFFHDFYIIIFRHK